MPRTVTTMGVLDEVADERQRQDNQWGGPGHDDGHDLINWTVLLEERCEKIEAARKARDPRRVRSEAIVMAALAVAMVEAMDRRAWDPDNFQPFEGEPEAADD